MAEAFLGLGANLGNCVATLGDALRRLHGSPGVSVTKVSSLYRSRPVGGIEQPDFWNAVAAVETQKTPEELLHLCLAVEAALGRVRRERWGPRQIDLDLLWHGDGERISPALTLPHPRMTERSFVMAPLAEIAPERVVAGRRADAWARDLGSEGLSKQGPLAWEVAP